jgi:hypothetical protein
MIASTAVIDALTPRQEFFAGAETLLAAAVPFAVFAAVFFAVAWRLCRQGKSAYEHAQALPFHGEKPAAATKETKR